MKLIAPLFLLHLVHCNVITGLNPILYSHNDEALQGYVSIPSANTSSNTKFPTVLILSDWNGVNEYEKKRAEMISKELGYVAFATDMFGKDLAGTDMETKIKEVTRFRSNTTFWMERVQSAIDVVKKMNNVDVNNMALIGYCFGGTGVITYATAGYDEVKAIVSFHGGLSGLDYDNATSIKPKTLILSGGDDDTSSNIENMEVILNAGNATWEINRFSGVEHAFTVWDDPRYNERADTMAWSSMKTFLGEAFGSVSYTPNPPANPVYDAISYKDIMDNTDLEGYIARPSNPANTKRPAVIVLPDWDGVNNYEKTRARMFADLGFVALAADIYGAELHDVEDYTEKIGLVAMYRNNIALFASRIKSAVNLMKQQDNVDTDAIILAGYCFGGTGALAYALLGHDDVHTVVSFHGGLGLDNATGSVHPNVLVLSGGDDDTSSRVTDLENTLNLAGATWQISRYSDVKHGFTKFGSFAYDKRADIRSWESMEDYLLFNGLFQNITTNYFAGDTKVSNTDEGPNVDDASGSGKATLPFFIGLATALVGWAGSNL